MFLEEILRAKQQEVAALKETFQPQSRVRPIYGFSEALTQRNTLGVIAEIKRGSPSKGLFAPDLDITQQASHYQAGGAAAISVLTDPHFWGSYEDLTEIVEKVTLPVLAKDFIIDPIQIQRAYSFGADMVLLIAAILSKEKLQELYHYGRILGMDVLVELHGPEDIQKIQGESYPLMGYNHRNLNSFHTEKIRPALYENLFQLDCQHLIAESGIETSEDAHQLAQLGFSGLLVGEHLVRAENPEALLTSFSSIPRQRKGGPNDPR